MDIQVSFNAIQCIVLRNTFDCVVRSRQPAQARCIAFKHQAQGLQEKHRATKYEANIAFISLYHR